MFYIIPMEVYESHKLRTYAFIGVTIFFAVFLMILTGFGIALGGIMALKIFVPIDCLVLIPLGSASFHFYYSKLWIKFLINEEKFEIVGPHYTNSVYWSEFDHMRLKVKGHKTGFIQATSRARVDFKIHFYRKDSKRIVKDIKFHFFKQSKGGEILNLILTHSQNLGKDVILTKRYM